MGFFNEQVRSDVTLALGAKHSKMRDQTRSTRP